MTLSESENMSEKMIADPAELEESIVKAKSWLVNSGIQNTGSRLLDVKGGFNSWYNINDENYFYTYSEITGYAITNLLFLHKREDKNIYLLKAILAAEWLLDKASHKSGGVKTRYFLDEKNANELYDFTNGVVHSFDNGIVLNGLMDIYEATKEERYMKVANKIGNLLVETMQKEDGSLYASYSHKEESFKDHDEKWSTQSGSFHAKVAMGLLKLYEATKNNKYKEAVVKLCNSALKLQEVDGRFISYKKEKDTHLHPHCYSAEGLLFAGIHLKNEAYIKSAVNATKWALEMQMENKGIPSMYVKGEPVAIERSDVLAQVLRLGTITRSMNLIDEKYDPILDSIAKRLLEFQYKNEELSIDGGFSYGHDVDYRNNLKGEKKNHANSWCTMFALQALVYYKDYKEGKFVFDKNELV